MSEIVIIEEEIKTLTATTMDILNGGEISEHINELSKLNAQIKELQIIVDNLKQKAQYESNVGLKMSQAMKSLQSLSDDITEFDENIIRQNIDVIQIMGAEKIHIIFKDGFECDEYLEDMNLQRSA